MAPAPRARWRRRGVAAAGALLLSLGLHALALGWLDRHPAGPAVADPTSSTPVRVALLSAPEPARAGLSGVTQVRSEASPKPAAARRRPPAPRPAAITSAPDVSAPASVAPPPESDPWRMDTPDAEAGSADAGDRATDTPAPPSSRMAAAEGGALSSEATTGASVSAGGPADADAATPTEPPTMVPPPLTGRWRFQVHYGDYTERAQVASIDYVITLDGERYAIRSEGRAEGLTALLYSGVLSQSSTGTLADTGLQPQRYAERRGSRAERWAEVNRTAGVVDFSGGERVPLVPGAQDRLSALVQLGLLARARPDRFAPGAVVEIPEVTLRDIASSRYVTRGERVLETDSGPLRTLWLERVAPRKPDDPSVEVWLGYDRGLLPVRIRFTDPGGRVLDQISPP